MLTLTLRDLQYRKRQFAIAVVGAALVFAILLILTGISAGFTSEAEDTVDAVEADAWIVPEGVRGPFSAVSTMPASLAGQLRETPGVEAAAPLVTLSNTLEGTGEPKRINVLGVERGQPGDPATDEGEGPRRSGEAVVNDSLDVAIGDTFTISGREFTAVGVVNDRTYLGGVPVVYTTIRDAQELAFDGGALANAIVVRGDPESLPKGFHSLSNGAVVEDMVDVLEGAKGIIDTIRILMWIVAGVIIGAVMYLSALERLQDFAVLKAVGGESRSIGVGLSLQAVITALLAAALGSLLAALLRPLFPVPVTISGGAYLALAGVALLAGVLASFVALRRVLKVDPALAFG